MRLDGQVAMITGAARSLGRSHALTFAREGADLLLVDRCRQEGPYPLAERRDLEETAAACRRTGSRVVTAVADVRDQSAVEAALAAGLDEFGRIDVLVNNAGLLTPGGVRSHELSEDDWNLVIDVNLNGTWRCCRAVLPHMVAQRSGTIVNTASTGGRVAFEMYSSYVASKHAVVGLTKALALEYGRYGIRVNAVCPSTVAADDDLGSRSTRAVARTMGSSLEDYERSSSSYHAIGRLVTAQEVSAACLWLAGPESGGTTGTELLVDGGFTAR
ncbi:SDR family oxidoreductase [Streptomyces sp. AF1A]|jgi:NAD(P)-dependent dehydrogenase (short-subunit alcohol dehydrogenase family)|uniref:SDR family oxidoreductase n=1 Tax=Streptomyces sp. AF1A TaxID=3394350 RepID=UPI0039BD8BC8